MFDNIGIEIAIVTVNNLPDKFFNTKEAAISLYRYW
jgi:hypothetical protein